MAKRKGRNDGSGKWEITEEQIGAMRTDGWTQMQIKRCTSCGQPRYKHPIITAAFRCLIFRGE